MARSVTLIDLRELSGTDKAIVGLMVDDLMRIARERDIDLGDEREIGFALAGWYEPADILRLMDHITEQARIARQERVTIGDILGTAAVVLFAICGALLTLIPTEAFAATGSVADESGYGLLAIAALAVLGLVWAFTPTREAAPEETDNDEARRYEGFSQ